MSKEHLTENRGQESEGYYFEGVNIQWRKSKWSFHNPGSDTEVEIDTYSIWNPKYHPEIADRLASGQRCALYMMGNFGVGELFMSAVSDERHEILDKIKQRERAQNLAIFAHPREIGKYLDADRLPETHRGLMSEERREALYTGPLHVILPIKEDLFPNSALYRKEDRTASFFWIPGHWGYEQLIAQMRERNVEGLFGGGSLNIHGQEPSYTTHDLRDREMVRHPQWLDGIDFVIIDEIAEAASIGRSHTQVSFMKDPPAIIRLGSMSPEKISQETGYKLGIDADRRLASSKTPYNVVNNQDSDRKIEIVLARMARYQDRLGIRGRSSGEQI